MDMLIILAASIFLSLCTAIAILALFYPVLWLVLLGIAGIAAMIWIAWQYRTFRKEMDNADSPGNKNSNK